MQHVKTANFSTYYLHVKWAVGVAKTTTEVNQVVINTNCILQLIK